MDVNEGGIVLSDFIGNSELSIIVSKEVKVIIEKVCGDSCEYQPLSIKNRKGGIASSEYFYINPIGTYDFLNKKESIIEYNDRNLSFRC